VLWHAQLYHFSMLAAAAEDDSVRCLAASDFLHEPETVLQRALDYFGLNCDAAQLTLLSENGPLSKHSKSGDRYDADIRSDENTALAAEYDSELQSTFDWMGDLLDTLPIDLPLQLQL
jgi:hypothetical protein